MFCFNTDDATSVQKAIHDFPLAAAFVLEDEVKLFARALERDEIAAHASFVLKTYVRLFYFRR